MKKRVLGVDTGVVMLGIVSFLTDVSSEMIFSVFSMFFTLFAGALWMIKPEFAFIAAAAITLCAMIAFVLVKPLRG